MSSKKSEKRHRLILIIIVVLILAIVFMLGRHKKGVSVVVAKADIEAGTMINESNIDSLFTIKKVDEELAASNTITKKSLLNGKSILIGLNKNTLMQKSFVENPEKEINKMQNPVVMGLKVTDMSQMVCGTIRKNDIIDISVINSQSDECLDVIRNVRVSDCYNSDGTMIEDEGCATCITVIVEKDDEQYINEMMALGELRICKAGGISE